MAGNALSRARAAQAMRMAGVAIALFLLGGILLLMAPAPPSTPQMDIARVAPRLPQPPAAWHPPYALFLSERGNPFEPGPEPASPAPPLPVEPQPAPPEPDLAPPPPPPPPPPRPDTQGLRLVGTAPGSQGGFAIFTDRHNGLTFVAAEGERVRNAVLLRVLADQVILALGEQEAAIELPPIPGSR